MGARGLAVTPRQLSCSLGLKAARGQVRCRYPPSLALQLLCCESVTLRPAVDAAGREAAETSKNIDVLWLGPTRGLDECVTSSERPDADIGLFASRLVSK